MGQLASISDVYGIYQLPSRFFCQQIEGGVKFVLVLLQSKRLIWAILIICQNQLTIIIYQLYFPIVKSKLQRSPKQQGVSQLTSQREPSSSLEPRHGKTKALCQSFQPFQVLLTALASVDGRQASEQGPAIFQDASCVSFSSSGGRVVVGHRSGFKMSDRNTELKNWRPQKPQGPVQDGLP